MCCSAAGSPTWRPVTRSCGRPVALGLQLESNRFDIEPEITAKLLRQGHRIVERPVTFDPRNRASGKKIGWRDGVHAVGVLLKYRLQRF